MWFILSIHSVLFFRVLALWAVLLSAGWKGNSTQRIVVKTLGGPGFA